ncbi:MAG: single-stranded DNA-binding protein [Thermodesulfobacteriota bacterium]|nr:single-stranded DNA-binding protein [Thermodesulfobacteriota bacterium]
MASLNRVQLIGYVGKDPEVRYTSSQKAVVNFSVATTDKWTANGEKKSHTEWHNIESWDRLAEICGKYLSKGSLIYIEGSIYTQRWEDQQNNKQHMTKIRVRSIQILGNGASSGDKSQSQQVPENNPDGEINNDIPF